MSSLPTPFYFSQSRFSSLAVKTFAFVSTAQVSEWDDLTFRVYFRPEKRLRQTTRYILWRDSRCHPTQWDSQKALNWWTSDIWHMPHNNQHRSLLSTVFTRLFSNCWTRSRQTLISICKDLCRTPTLTLSCCKTSWCRERTACGCQICNAIDERLDHSEKLQNMSSQCIQLEHNNSRIPLKYAEEIFRKFTHFAIPNYVTVEKCSWLSFFQRVEKEMNAPR